MPCCTGRSCWRRRPIPSRTRKGPLCPTGAAPIFVSDIDDFVAKIEPVKGKPLTFKAPDLIRGADRNLELIPFFRLHDSRYVVYWPHATPEELEDQRRARTEAEQARLALEAQTIDHVAPGEQQPESDHFFKGEETEAGLNKGRHWRHARAWFSYELTDEAREARTLRLTYYGLDRDRRFDILMNGVEVATVELDGSHGDAFFSVDYPVPAEALEKAVDGKLVTTFVAHSGSVAGGIYDVRLLRAADGGKQND
jgi:hypothetical protein